MSLEFPFEYATLPRVGLLFYPVVRIFLQTTIGWKEFEFLVDTGADITTIPSSLLPILGLQKTRLIIGTTSGVGGISVRSWEFKLSIKIGTTPLLAHASAVDDRDGHMPLLLGRKDIFDGPFSLTLDSQRHFTVLHSNPSSASS